MSILLLHEERHRLLTQRRLRRFPRSARKRLMRLERRIDGIEWRAAAPRRAYHEETMRQLREIEQRLRELEEETRT